MAVLLFLFWGFGEITLESAPERVLLPTVSASGILASDGNQVYHWDFEGRLIRQISCRGLVLAKIHFQGFYLFAEVENETGAFFTEIYNNNGMLVGTTDYHQEFFNLGESLWVLSGLPAELLRKTPHPFLLRQGRLIENAEGKLSIEMKGEPFHKAMPRVRELSYNFQRLWVVQDWADSLVMNQLEPRIYRFSPQTRSQERQEGARAWTSVPFEQLDLPMFKVVNQLFKLKKVMPVAEARAAKDAWFRSFSRIEFFGRYLDQYLVSYSLPSDVPGESVRGYVVLDEDFQRISEFNQIDGIIIGLYGDKLFEWDSGHLYSYQPQ